MVPLYIDILEGRGIHTYRDQEHDLLMGIRNGKISFGEVFRMTESYEEKIKRAYETSPLPERPNEEAINDMLVEIYRRYL